MRAQRGTEQLVAARIVNGADADGALRSQRDRYTKVGNPLDVVQAAADRIDDPQVLGVQGKGFVFGTLFGEHAKVRRFFSEDVENRVLDFEAGARDDVAVALPAHVITLAEARQRDLSPRPRRPRSNIQGQGV